MTTVPAVTATSSAADTKAAVCPTDPLTMPDAAGVFGTAMSTCRLDCPRCHALITTAQLKAIYTAAPDARIEEAKLAFNENFEKFEINHCVRKAHLFAQSREEVGAKMRLDEDLTYDADRLKRKVATKGKRRGPFKYFRSHPAEADLYGRTPTQSANFQEIANHAYAGKNGNDKDIAIGDGYRYRGGGLIQVTGKGNYAAVQPEIDAKVPGSGIDIVARPDDIHTAKGAMISAMAFWSQHGLNAKAEAGTTDDDVDSITEVINSGTDSKRQRRSHFKVTSKVFRVPECVNLVQAAPAASPAKKKRKKKRKRKTK